MSGVRRQSTQQQTQTGTLKMNYTLQQLILFATCLTCLVAGAEHYPGSIDDFNVPTAKARLQDAQARHLNAQRKLADLQQALGKFTTRRQALHAESRELTEEAGKQQRQITEHERGFDNAHAANQNADNQLTKLRQQHATAADTANKHRAQIGRLDARLAHTRKKLQQGQDEYADAAAHLASHRDDNAVHDDENCARFQREAKAFEKQAQGLTHTIDKLIGRKAAFAGELQTLEGQIRKSNTQISTVDAEVDRSNGLANTYRQSLQQRRNELDRICARVAVCEGALRDLAPQIDEYSRRQRHWQHQCDEQVVIVKGLRRQLHDARDNYRRALHHIKRAAARHGRDGAKEGRDLAVNHAATQAEHLGEEIGRERGENDGIARARQQGATVGKKNGIDEGRTDAQGKASPNGKVDGRATGLKSRGFDDGFKTASAEPNIGHQTYRQAYARGENHATTEAQHFEYPRGVKAAEDEFYNAALAEYVLDNSGATSFETSFSGLTPAWTPATSVRPQKPLFNEPTYNVTKHKRRTSKPSQIRGHDKYAEFAVDKNRIKTLARKIESVAIDVPLGRNQNWAFKYFDPDVVRYPYRPLQRHFEETYHDAYFVAAAEAYDETFDETFSDILQIVADEVYGQYVDPQRYGRDQAQARDEAFDYWRERSWNKTYNDVYAQAHQAARQHAYDNPDTDAGTYRSGHQAGTALAHQRAGFGQGYKDLIADAGNSQRRDGFNDRAAFFRDHPDFKDIEIRLQENNRDGYFGIGETFSASVSLRNYGLASQAAGSLGVTMRIVSGPANPIAAGSTVHAVPGQSVTRIDNVVSARVDHQARPHDRFVAVVTVHYHNTILAEEQFERTVRYPMTVDRLQIPQRVYTNTDDNTIHGRIVNNSKGNPPGPIELHLFVDGEKNGEPITIRPLHGGKSTEFAIPFAPTPTQFLSHLDLSVRAVSGGIVQARSNSRRTFASRRSAGTGTVLITVHDLAMLNLKPVVDALTGAGAQVDLFERRYDGVIDIQALSRHSFAIVGGDIDLATRDGIGNILAAGGDVLIAGSLQTDPTAMGLLDDRGVVIKGTTNGGTLATEHFLEDALVSTGFGQLPKFRLPKRSKSRVFYKLLTGPDRRLFAGKPTVGFRCADVKTGGSLTVLGFGIDKLKAESATTLLVRAYLMSRPVPELAERYLTGKGTRRAERVVLAAIISEEIQCDNAVRGKLYNSKYNDVTATDLYAFQASVLDRADLPRYPQLVALAPVFSKRIDSRNSRKLIKSLMTEYRRLK
jgi:predicted  nucleic acid-binding Zn-ribbon protein